MKWSLLMIAVCCSIQLFGQEIPKTISIKGKVVDKDDKERLPFVYVSVMVDNVLQSGTHTNYDGEFQLLNVENKGFTIKVEFVGYVPKEVSVPANLLINISDLTIKMEWDEDRIPHNPVSYYIPLIDFENTSSGSILREGDISKVPDRN
ncbi:MAG: carboxypeptidase-like regulatory domain-containing protein [Bacteroidota bacterium]